MRQLLCGVACVLVGLLFVQHIPSTWAFPLGLAMAWGLNWLVPDET